MKVFNSEFNNAKIAMQNYAQVISDVKGSFSAHQKNWEEYSLKVYAKGLTTTPIPIKRKNYFDALDLNINMVEHKLKIFCAGERLSVDLKGQSQIEFAEELKEILKTLQIEYVFEENKFTDLTFGEYKEESIEEIWAILKEVYFAMLKFKSDKLEEASNINFWAHHFDLAMLMFNGKIISDQDPDNWDYSREQMNYGFSFGDDAITTPYFYITQYPFNNKMFELDLPEKAYWQKDGWQGAVFEIEKYESLEEIRNINDRLFSLIYEYSIKQSV